MARNVHTDAAERCRDWIRKVKVQMEVNLAWDAKNNKTDFLIYVGQKRQAKESVPPLKYALLDNEKEQLATTDVDKAEVLKKFFASVFTGGQASHVSHILKHGGWS